MSTLTFQNIVDDGSLLFLETHHFQDRFDDGFIKVEFDENNRLSNLETSLGGQR